MTTTAMLFGPGGAQRVTVLAQDAGVGSGTLIETRDGDRGYVDTRLLTDFREESE